jgi:hypothetical protein
MIKKVDVPTTSTLSSLEPAPINIEILPELSWRDIYIYICVCVCVCVCVCKMIIIEFI